jgi:hypothetical protein
MGGCWGMQVPINKWYSKGARKSPQKKKQPGEKLSWWKQLTRKRT